MGSLFSRKKKQHQTDTVSTTANNVESSATTDEILDSIVDRYMKNDLINNPAIPDWIERKMYKNVLKMTIGIASDTINNSEFEFLGHIISLNVRPKSQT